MLLCIQNQVVGHKSWLVNIPVQSISHGTDCSYYSRDLVLPFLLWHIFLMKANGPIFHFLALDGKILNESDLSGIIRKVQNLHCVSFSFFNLLHSKIMVQIPINPQ